MKKTITADTCRVLADGQPEITITTEAVDRMRDRVIQSGLTFPETLPVLFGHDMHSLPVGVSGRASMIRGAQQTRARWRWIEGDARADAVRNTYDQGGLASSIGMLVHESEPNSFGGHDITRAEVVEFSLVPVPANPECTRLLKVLGWGADDVVLDLDLDADDEIGLDPAEVTAAIRTLIPQLAAAEVARLHDRLLDPEIDLARIDGDDFDPAGNPVDRAMLVDAVKTAIPALLRAEINRLKGRID